jgi:hypothetical protein
MWINTKAEFEWDGEKYVETSCEGYEYSGEVAECFMNMDEGVATATDDSAWSGIGSFMSLFDKAAKTNPYMNVALGVGKMLWGAKQETDEANRQIGVIDKQLGGLQQSMRDLGESTEARKDVSRMEFGTGVTQLGKSTSYGMEDITAESQRNTGNLIREDHRAKQKRERTTEAYGAQIQKQEDAFSRDMMAADEMFSTEANKIDAQTKSLKAERQKHATKGDFWDNVKRGMLGG